MFDDELAAIPPHPPRPSVLPGMRLSATIPRFTLLFLTLFVVFFAVFPLSVMISDPQMRLAVGPNRTVEGRVLSVADAASCRGSAARRLVYAFSSPSGNEFRGARVVCEESPYFSAQAGDRIEIRYLARDPALNSIAGTDVGNEPPLFLLVFFPAFVLLMISPLYVPQVREVLRARRLYKKGALARGKVIFVKKRGIGAWPGWPASNAADVYVAHELPGGKRTETRVRCTNDWLLNQLSPGASVHILLPPGRSTPGDTQGSLLEAFIR